MSNLKMRKIVETQQPLTLKIAQFYLKGLYAKPNSQRSFTDYYAYLDRTAGYLCKAIYENFNKKHFLTNRDIQTLEGKFIRPISWLFTLSADLNIQLEDAFLKRFPEICPYCLQRECVCFKTDRQPLQNMPAFRIQEEMNAQYNRIVNKIKVSGNDSITLDWAVKNITNIFGVNEIVWYYAGPWHHISKIHEEIAEVHEAYIRYKRGSVHISVVANEIADVLAWILGAWGIIFPERSLVDAFKTYYLDECPVCNTNPCQCDLFAGRPDEIIDYSRLEEIKEELEKLEQILPLYKKDIYELKKSIDTAIKTQSEPIAKTSLKQILKKAKYWTSTSKDMNDTAFIVVTNIISITDTLLRNIA